MISIRVARCYFRTLWVSKNCRFPALWQVGVAALCVRTFIRCFEVVCVRIHLRKMSFMTCIENIVKSWNKAQKIVHDNPFACFLVKHSNSNDFFVLSSTNPYRLQLHGQEENQQSCWREGQGLQIHATAQKLGGGCSRRRTGSKACCSGQRRKSCQSGQKAKTIQTGNQGAIRNKEVPKINRSFNPTSAICTISKIILDVFINHPALLSICLR